jgi:aspartate racemase
MNTKSSFSECKCFREKVINNAYYAAVSGPVERVEIEGILDQLMGDRVIDHMKIYFNNLITKYKDHDAVILGCTELPLVVTQDNSLLPIINPTHLQCVAGVEFALA